MGPTALIALLVCVGHVTVEAGQKCQGSPRMYNGKRCASTTNYNDNHKGACGCGPDKTDNQFSWNHNGLVTAPSQHLYDSGGKGWCGGSCGKCFRLTTTGGFVDGQGGQVPEGQSKVFMATNLCPDEYPNLSWCSQRSSNNYVNQYGYGEHFDLEKGNNQLGEWQGKNPEVTWEYSDCNGPHNQDSKTPNDGMYHQCFCSRHPDGGKK